MRLQKEDLDRVVRRIPPFLLRFMEQWWPPLIVAGGFVRGTIAGEELSDLDLFGDAEQVGRLIPILSGTQGVRTIETDNATTFIGLAGRGGESLPVQVVTKWPVGDPRSLIEHFDFSVCAAAVWRDAPTGRPDLRKWDSFVADAFYPDLAARRLRFQRPAGNTAGGTLLRVLRFASRGYRISPEDLAAVVAGVYASTSFEGGAGEFEKAVVRELREVDPRAADIDGDPPSPDDPVPTGGGGADEAIEDDIEF